MKYCQYCGAELHNEAVLCVKCGRFVQPMNNMQQPPMGTNQNNDTISTGLVILSVLFPIFGIIYWAVMAKKKPNRAKACGIAGLVSWIISFILTFAL